MICPHRSITFPMKLRGESQPHTTCGSCFRRIPYDWQNMRVMKPESRIRRAWRRVFA